MAKVELFNIEEKKQAQRKAEMALSPSQRLLLCLDLMDLQRHLPHHQTRADKQDDSRPWIVLHCKK